MPFVPEPKWADSAPTSRLRSSSPIFSRKLWSWSQSQLPLLPDLREAAQHKLSQAQVPEAELKYYLLFPKFLGTL
jgi:hypothetical protein